MTADAGRRTGGGASTLGVVLALVSVPVVLALVEGIRFHAANRNSGAIVSSGERREYLLHVPRSYDRRRPTPLVISMHGAGLWPAAQRDISRWDRVAEEHGFIVVYPSGVDAVAARIWRYDRGPGLAADVRFIADLIDTLAAAYTIDPARIYADGMSNGGGMAWALSCTLPGRVAAVGMVAAALLLPWDWCPDPRPVPMIAFHGTGDRITPYNGGTTWVAPTAFPAVPAFAARWARRNGCATAFADSAVAASVTRRRWAGCEGDADVVLYSVRDGGHAWPGGQPVPEWFGGSTSREVDATREMWAFFQAHRRAHR